MDYEHVDFPAAVRKLAARVGIPVVEERSGGGAKIDSMKRGALCCSCTRKRRNGFTKILLKKELCRNRRAII